MLTDTSLPSGTPQVEAVVCSACHRANLTGGLRCAYCGTYLASTFDFDLSAPTTPPPPPTEAPPPAPSGGKIVGSLGFLGTLALLAFKLKTFASLLSLGKVLVTLGSMFLFIVADAQIFGWRLGIGIGISILIHELGHVFVNWRKGISQTAPMFLPFVGAVILVKRFPNNPQIESESGAGGPFAGGLAALGCLVLASITHDPFYLSLANIGFAINLFNLVPFAFLDGAHIGSVFSPKAWWTILLVMVLWVLKVNTPALWLIILGTLLLRLLQKDDGRYLLASPIVRARMAVLYVVMAIGLSYGATHTLVQRNEKAPAQVAALQTGTSSGASTTPQSQPPAAAAVPPPATPDTDRWSAGRWLFRGSIFAVVALLWWGALRLIGRAARRAWDAAQTRAYAFVLSLCLLSQATTLLVPDTLMSPDAARSLILANLAAAAIALVFAIVQAVRAGSIGARPHLPLLRLQALAWAGGGALLVAYSASSGWLFALLAIVLSGFFLLYPAARFLTLSGLASFIGDDSRAAQLLEQAGQAAPPALATAIAARRIATHLANERGEAALPLLTGSADASRQEGDLLQHQNFLVTALAQNGRFEDALPVLEQLLQGAASDARRSLTALHLAHYHLAFLALRRGWWDETLAQTDWLLTNGSKSGGLATLALRLRALAEAARFAQRQTSAGAVEAACNRALAQSHDPTGRAIVACATVSRLLSEGNTDAARAEAAKALRLRPLNVQVRYWNARAQGRESLQQFAAEHPDNFWGRQAQHDLETDTVPPPIPA